MTVIHAKKERGTSRKDTDGGALRTHSASISSFNPQEILFKRRHHEPCHEEALPCYCQAWYPPYPEVQANHQLSHRHYCSRSQQHLPPTNTFVYHKERYDYKQHPNQPHTDVCEELVVLPLFRVSECRTSA